MVLKYTFVSLDNNYRLTYYIHYFKLWFHYLLNVNTLLVIAYLCFIIGSIDFSTFYFRIYSSLLVVVNF